MGESYRSLLAPTQVDSLSKDIDNATPPPLVAGSRRRTSAHLAHAEVGPERVDGCLDACGVSGHGRPVTRIDIGRQARWRCSPRNRYYVRRERGNVRPPTAAILLRSM